MTFLLTALAGFTVTAVMLVGVPIVGRLADLQLRRTQHADTYDGRARVTVTRTTTLKVADFGPDTMRWPSELGRGNPYVDKLAWPSSQWTDPAFGPNRVRSRPKPTPAVAKTPKEPSRDATRGTPSPTPTDRALAQKLRTRIAEDGFAAAVRQMVQDDGLHLDEIKALLALKDDE